MANTELRRPRVALDGPAARPKGGKRRKAEEAIAALMAGRTIKQAAQECSIGYRTLKTWLASEWFQAEYRAARQRLLDSTINQLRSIGSEGVAGLHDVVTNTSHPAAARVSAARAILEVLLKAVEVQDVTTRLQHLEDVVKADDL
jgi:ribosomal protein S11